MPRSVVKDWVNCLPIMQQSVLLISIRGCDGVHKEDLSKALTRRLRGVLLHNADSSNSFIIDQDCDDFLLQFDKFIDDIDHYPVHWVLHFMHAAEIVGYKHPDNVESVLWRRIYFAMVHSFHLTPETEQQLDARLTDGVFKEGKVA